MSDNKLLNDFIWRQLTAAGAALPHALLFAGPAGLGKRELADALALRLLCERPRQAFEMACGQCDSCLMMANGQHPDFRLLQPDAAADSEDETPPDGEKKKASKQIRIQQVREVEEFFYVGGHRGGARVCLIDPAESMNGVTANSLLKILEEPSSSFYFLMISHGWRKLLPTILSRSRRIMFAPPETTQAHAWLKEHKLAEQAKWLPFFGNAPLEIADAAKSGRLKGLETLVTDLQKPLDPLSQAARWESLVKTDSALNMEELVTTIQKWLFDLGRCAIGAAPRFFPQLALKAQAQQLALPVLMQAAREVARMRGLASHPLNARLFLEDLCVRAFRPLGK